MMGRGKLILICQSGGKFVTNDEGSLSYTGGEAHAVNINHETFFDDLKLKLAEMWNLEYQSLSIKYFLPGNRKTLITLSTDKDLKRMIGFHGDSVTADVFVMGREGFDSHALNIHACRESGIKLAETVNHIAVSMTPAVAPQPFAIAPVSLGVMPSGAFPIDPVTVVTDVASPDTTTTVAHAAVTVSPVAPATFPVSTVADSLTAVDATAQSLNGISTTANPFAAFTITSDPSAAAPTPTVPVVIAAIDATAHGSVILDITSTPADTVKKRRRTASWKFGANGPTIVSVTDDVGGKKRTASRKKNSRSQNTVPVADNVEQQQENGPWKDDFNGSSSLVTSDDVPLEKLVASWKDGITGVGQEFKSVYEFREALQKYAIAHRFVYRLKKNDTNRASGRCVAEGCSWRIHASWVPAAQSFRIKKMTKSHTCGGQSWKSAHPTKNWLVSIIKDRLQDTPHHKPKDIAKCIFQDFGIELNYTQVWRGIEDAREQLQGSYKEAYNLLPWFCEKLVETNPGSVAKLLINDDKRFERLFVSFHASLHGFQNGCRPLLFLDATSLKSKYQEILLIATAVDGNEGFFPVAFAIVDVETDDNWLWFLEQLKSAISTLQPMTFVSDREKGLKKSVLEVFENAHHGYSIYYLMENFKKNLKGPFHGDGRGSLPINFLAATHAIRLDGFKKSTEQIKRVSSKAYNWVMQIEPECWATVSFEGEHYNQITVDVIHAYINLIEEVRELPIIQKIEALICMIMESINTCQTDSSTWSSQLTPSKEEKLQDEIIKARSLKVLFSTDTLFEVHDDSINVVNIDSWDCSCLQWKATGLPCCHAIAIFNCTGRSVYDYCSRYFTLNSFRLTYSESINPLPSIIKSLDNEEAALHTLNVLPPCTLRPLSQQKRKRVKTEEVMRRAVSCTRCKLAGHNKATCKATL